MRQITTFFVLIVFSLLGFRAVEKPILDFKIDDFDVDILGNTYTVRDAELKKYNDKLELQATYSNLSLGAISSIDASDAMNLLVFYEDFAKVLFLDNTLSVKKSAISLSDLGFPNASLACLSYNNAFWIFDPSNQELIRISQFLNIAERSGNLNQIIQTEIEPKQLIESGNTVYLVDEKEGVFVFDRYAGFLKRLPFLGIDNLRVNEDNSLTFLRKDSLFTYDMNTLKMDTTVLTEKRIEKIVINENTYTYLNKSGLLYRENRIKN